MNTIKITKIINVFIYFIVLTWNNSPTLSLEIYTHQEESDNNNNLFLVNAHSTSFSSFPSSSYSSSFSSISTSSPIGNNNNNTVILQFVQKFPDRPCAESRVIMRYVGSHGGRVTVIGNEIQFNFSSVNFCPTNKVEVYPLTMKRFNLIIYLEEVSNSTDSNSESRVKFSAMVVGWDGIVYKRYCK